MDGHGVLRHQVTVRSAQRYMNLTIEIQVLYRNPRLIVFARLKMERIAHDSFL